MVVVNAKDLVLTGAKLRQGRGAKLYRWHTGHPGGLKTRTAKEIIEGNGRAAGKPEV